LIFRTTYLPEMNPVELVCLYATRHYLRNRVYPDRAAL